MKTAILLVICLLAVILGAQASAWRRASVYIAQSAKIYRSLEHGTIPEDGLGVSDAMISEFEPPFVVWRKRTAIIFTLAAAIEALFFYRWYWAVAAFVVCLVLAEIVRMIVLPKADHNYYLIQLLDDFENRARLAESFNNEAAPSLRHSAQVLRRMVEERAKKLSESRAHGA